MHISGVTTCVNFSDLFEKSIGRWSQGLDKLIVATTPEDMRTGALCDMFSVKCHRTTAFSANGAMFNKAGAMDECLSLLGEVEWVLFFDSDVIPAQGWRQHLVSLKPKPGNLYGAVRTDERGKIIHDSELAGFFQLFYSTDSAAQDRPLLGNWISAGSYDSKFITRWPQSKRIILPLKLTHQGPVGKNWCGRGRDDKMKELYDERRRTGTWEQERLK